MTLFNIKSVNKALANHVRELKKFGFIEDNWHWYRKKILKLKRIDSELIKDLLEIHNKNGEVQDLFKDTNALLNDLDRMLRENPDSSAQKARASKANQLISRILLAFSLLSGAGFVQQAVELWNENRPVSVNMARVEKDISSRKPVAYLVLELEARLGANNDDKKIIDIIIRESKKRIKVKNHYTVEEAKEVLRTISYLLHDLGFKYGPTKSFHECLENKIIDCDQKSIIYMSLAQVLNLPLVCVLMPGDPAGHMYIRWLFPNGTYIPWETTIDLKEAEPKMIEDALKLYSERSDAETLKRRIHDMLGIIGDGGLNNLKNLQGVIIDEKSLESWGPEELLEFEYKHVSIGLRNRAVKLYNEAVDIRNSKQTYGDKKSTLTSLEKNKIILLLKSALSYMDSALSLSPDEENNSFYLQIRDFRDKISLVTTID